MFPYSTVTNTFLEKFSAVKTPGTHVVFVLATVNDITKTAGGGSKSSAPVADEDDIVAADELAKADLPTDDERGKSTALLGDEGLIDLEHMCGWCPTAGYGALLAEKVRGLRVWGEQAKAA